MTFINDDELNKVAAEINHNIKCNSLGEFVKHLKIYKLIEDVEEVGKWY